MKSQLLGIFLLAFLSISLNIFAQTNYKTRASGNWNNPATWQIESPQGSNIWIPASSTPTSADGAITILSTLTVTITQNVSIDQLMLHPNSTLVVNDGVAVTLDDGTGTDLIQLNNSHIHLLGESFLQGPGVALFAGQLYVYSTNSTGAITAGTAATGNIRNSSRVYSAALTLHYVGAAKQYIGSGHPNQMGMTTVINNASNAELNNASSTGVSFNGNVSVVAGQLIVSNDDFSMVANTLTLNGGDLVLNSAVATRFNIFNNITVNTGNILITGGGFGLYLTIKGNLVLVGGDISAVNSTSTTSITINGNIDLQNRAITLSTASGNLYSTFNGDILGTGLITLNGSNNTVRINGTGTLTHAFPFAANSTFKSLEINRPSLLLSVPHTINVTNLSLINGNIDLNSNLIINSTLNFATGTNIDFSGQTLQCNGAVNPSLTGGSFTSNASSSLLFLSSNTIGAFSFTGGSSLGTLTLDRFGITLPINSAITVSTLNLTRGTVNNISGLTFASGGICNRQNLGFMTGAAPLGGPYNLNYSTGNLTTGIESLGSILNLTSNSYGTITVNGSITASGALSVNSGTFTCGANAVSAGSLLNAIGTTFNAPSSTLTIGGNLTSNGTFNPNNGTILFSGTGNITTSLLVTFNNITLSNSVNVSVESNARIKGVLTLGTNSILDADGLLNNRTLTFLSSSDIGGGDASIAAIPSGSSVVGNVTVQRYWSALDNVYRYISSPVANSPISQLQTSGIPITGDFTGTSFPCTGCDDNFINLGWYDETVPGYIWEGYQTMPASGNDNTETLVPGRGYELYMWNGVASSLWVTRGTVNQGSYPLEVSRTISSPPLSSEDGWNFVGNPYPSSISWNDNADLPGGWSMTGIDPIVWVWDVAAGGWKFFDASSNSGDLPGGKIATGQAFWINATGSSPSLTVHEAAKTGVSGAYYRQRENAPMLTITVAGSESVNDNAYLTLEDESGYTNVPKFSRGIEAISLALLSDEGKRLARFSMASLSDEIPISMVFKNEGKYEFSFSSTGESTTWDSYYLVDRYMNKATSIQSAYAFTVTKSAQTFENRFYLSRNREQAFMKGEIALSVYPNPTTSYLTVEVKLPEIQSVALTNNAGQVLRSDRVTYTDGIGYSQLDLMALQKGLYFVKIVNSAGKVYVQKVVKQ